MAANISLRLREQYDAIRSRPDADASCWRSFHVTVDEAARRLQRERGCAEGLLRVLVSDAPAVPEIRVAVDRITRELDEVRALLLLVEHMRMEALAGTAGASRVGR
ncbi:MAG TPA: hypothetical protein VK427_07000 [Kofleriaceae bacterium]|nr:hypothetical protein [Kofleriaceae bacterium]